MRMMFDHARRICRVLPHVCMRRWIQFDQHAEQPHRAIKSGRFCFFRVQSELRHLHHLRPQPVFIVGIVAGPHVRGTLRHAPGPCHILPLGDVETRRVLFLFNDNPQPNVRCTGSTCVRVSFHVGVCARRPRQRDATACICPSRYRCSLSPCNSIAHINAHHVIFYTRTSTHTHTISLSLPTATLCAVHKFGLCACIFSCVCVREYSASSKGMLLHAFSSHSLAHTPSHKKTLTSASRSLCLLPMFFLAVSFALSRAPAHHTSLTTYANMCVVAYIRYASPVLSFISSHTLRLLCASEPTGFLPHATQRVRREL